MAASNVEDFFEPLMQQKGYAIFLISLATVCAAIGASGNLGVLWFVNHSSEAKPTLMNRFIVKVCLTGFQYYFFVQVRCILLPREDHL